MESKATEASKAGQVAMVVVAAPAVAAAAAAAAGEGVETVRMAERVDQEGQEVPVGPPVLAEARFRLKFQGKTAVDQTRAAMAGRAAQAAAALSLAPARDSAAPSLSWITPL
jgi:hypothetical protein